MATTPTEPDQSGQPPVWFLTAEELDATRTKIATLNTRARRKGFTGTVTVAATTAIRSYTPAPGAPQVTVHGFDATITGQPPAYEGWVFVAAADTLPAQPGQTPAVVLRYPPGADQDLSNDEIRPGECDHCHTRRPRSSVYVVRHDETGELLQVGRSCLADFLGHNVQPVFIDTTTVAEQIERSLDSQHPSVWDLESVLTYAWAIVETHGFTPTSNTSNRTPTRDLVADLLAGGRNATKVLAGLDADTLTEGTQQAPLIITDLTAAMTSPSGYEANLAALLHSGQVPARQLGLAVSAIQAWQRLHNKQLTEQIHQHQRARYIHVGQIGQKITLTGTITVRTLLEGYLYDQPPRVLLVLDCGEALAKMITSALWAYDTRTGDQLTVTATVKAHTEYRDQAQTVLVRPRKLDNPALQPDEPALWETVTPVNPQSRFQEAPLAAPAPLGRGLGI